MKLRLPLILLAAVMAVLVIPAHAVPVSITSDTTISASDATTYVDGMVIANDSETDPGPAVSISGVGTTVTTQYVAINGIGTMTVGVGSVLNVTGVNTSDTSLINDAAIWLGINEKTGTSGSSSLTIDGTINAAAGVVAFGRWNRNALVTLNATGELNAKGLNFDKTADNPPNAMVINNGKMYLGSTGIRIKGGAGADASITVNGGFIGTLDGNWTSATVTGKEGKLTWIFAGANDVTFDTNKKGTTDGRYVTLDNIINGTGTGKFIKAGNGTLYIKSTDNTFNQTVEVQEGFLRVASDATSLNDPSQTINLFGSNTGYQVDSGEVTRNLVINSAAGAWVSLSGGSETEVTTFTGSLTHQTAGVAWKFGSGTDEKGTLILKNQNFDVTAFKVMLNGTLSLEDTTISVTGPSEKNDFVIGTQNENTKRNATLNINNNAVLSSVGSVLYLSTWNNAGHVNVNKGGTLEVQGIFGDGWSGSFNVNGGTAKIGAGNLRVTKRDDESQYNKLTFNDGAIEATADFSIHVTTGTSAPAVDVTNFSLVLGDRIAGTERVFNSAAHTISIDMAVSGDGDLTKTGTGTLLLNKSNTYTGGTLIKEGTVRIAEVDSLGAGAVSIDGGILDANGKLITNAVNVFSGSLLGVGGYETGNVIVQASGNVALNGLGGGSIKGLSTSDSSARISGIGSNVSVGSASSSFMLGNDQMKLSGTGSGTTIVDFASSGTLALGTVEFGLSSALLETLLGGGNVNYTIFVTNGTLSLNPGNVSFSNISGDMFDNIAVSGGNLTVDVIASNSTFLVATGQTYNVMDDSADPYASTNQLFNTITVNGTMNLGLPGAPTPGSIGQNGYIINHLSSGTDAGNAVINTNIAGAMGAVVLLVNNDKSSYYAGSILGEAAIKKQGTYNLTVGNTLKGASLSLEGGDLTVGNELNISGIVEVLNGTNLTVNGSANAGAIRLTSGNMSVVDNLTAGTVNLAGGRLTVGKDMNASSVQIDSGGLTVGQTLTSSGLVNVAGADLTVGSLKANGTVNISSGRTVNLGGYAASTVASLAGTGSVVLNNTTLQLTNGGAGGNVNLDNKISRIAGTKGVLELAHANYKFMGDNLLVGSGGIDTTLSLLLDATGSADLVSTTQTVSGLNGSGALVMASGGKLMVESSGDNVFTGVLNGEGSIESSGTGTLTLQISGSATYNVSQSRTGKTILRSPTDGGMLNYRDLGVDAPAGAARAELTLLNNTTANHVMLGSNGLLNLGGIEQGLMRSSGIYEAELTTRGMDISNGAAMNLTITSYAITASANTSWAYISSQGGSGINFTGDGTINLSVNGLGSLTEWTASRFNVNVLYSDTGFMFAGNPGTYDVSKINLVLEGFAGLVFETAKEVVRNQDGSDLFRISFVSRGENPLLPYANTGNQRAAAENMWAIASLSPAMDGVLADVLTGISTGVGSGVANPQDYSFGLSSYAGSGVTAMLQAQRGEMQQQVQMVRDRASQMNLDNDHYYTDAPYFNFWVQGNGGYMKIDDEGDKSGYELSSWGGTVGFDASFDENWTVGAAFTANTGDLEAYCASGDFDSYYANVFARLRSGRFAHSVILTYGWNEADLTRNVFIPAMDPLTMKGDTSGRSYGAFYEGTYDVYMNSKKTTILQPLINAGLYKTELDGYTETGAGNASMRVDDMDATYGNVGVGARLRGLIGSDALGRLAIGELRAQVVQDFGDDRVDAAMAPIGAPNIGMKVEGAKYGKTAGQIGAGLTVPIAEQGAIYANVNFEFRNHAENVHGVLGYRYSF